MNNRNLYGLLSAALCAGLFAAALNAQDKKGEDQLTIAVPLAVKYTIVKEAGGGKITGFTREQEDGKQVYDATVSLDGREYVIRTTGEGHLVRMEVKEHDEDRRDLKLDDLPAAIKASLAKHARGGTIREVDLQRISYSIKVKISGQNYRITVDSEGKLVKKEPVDE